MKTIAILLCALCFVSYTVVRADDLPKMSVSCMEKFGLSSLRSIPDMIRDDSEEGLRKRSCIKACYMERLGLMTGNIINVDAMDEQLDKVLPNNDERESIRQNMHQCVANSANDDQCVAAEDLSKCAFEHMRNRLQNVFNS